MLERCNEAIEEGCKLSDDGKYTIRNCPQVLRYMSPIVPPSTLYAKILTHNQRIQEIALQFFSTIVNIRVFHDKNIWCISVRLSDRSEVRRHKINFVKNCLQWDFTTQPPDHKSNVLLTVLGRNLSEISEVHFLLFHVPIHTLDFVYF